MVPESQEDSHLARSLNVPIFSANYRTAKQKARRLKPRGHRKDGRRAAPPPVLQTHVGKESGQVSYASRPLSASVSTERLLEAARDLQTAYSRLPLLLAPSKTSQFVSWRTTVLAVLKQQTGPQTFVGRMPYVWNC